MHPLEGVLELEKKKKKEKWHRYERGFPNLHLRYGQEMLDHEAV